MNLPLVRRPAICQRCHSPYTQVTYGQKYCEACQPEAAREYQRAYAQRNRARAKGAASLAPLDTFPAFRERRRQVWAAQRGAI